MVYAGTNARSYEHGHELLLELAERNISAKQLSRVTQRIGDERVAERDQAVAAYQQLPLAKRKAAPAKVTPPTVAAVMVDGGRLQILERGSETSAAPADSEATDEETLTEEPLRGHWREDKIGILLTLKSTAATTDPCPEIPEVFVTPSRMAKLTREIKGTPTPPKPVADDVSIATATATEETPAVAWEPPEVSARQVAATRGTWVKFGPIMAAMAWQHGGYAAERRAFVADGGRSNWTLWKQHFSSFVPILDFIHALTYVYAAAMTGRSYDEGWRDYETWIRAVWQGEVALVIAALAQRQQALGLPGTDDGETSPRHVVAEALTYLQNQQGRMRYPDYRRQGLPITSSHIESTIKQINQRVKGTEKFWSSRGSEAVLQLRADGLSDAQPLKTFWQTRQSSETGQRRYRAAA
jgi:hypothetical protein